MGRSEWDDHARRLDAVVMQIQRARACLRRVRRTRAVLLAFVELGRDVANQTPVGKVHGCVPWATQAARAVVRNASVSQTHSERVERIRADAQREMWVRRRRATQKPGLKE